MSGVASLAEHRSRKAAPGEPRVTKRDLAGELGVCEKTVERWQTDFPDFPVERWGPRLVRYRLSAVYAWLERRK